MSVEGLTSVFFNFDKHSQYKEIIYHPADVSHDYMCPKIFPHYLKQIDLKRTRRAF